MDERIIAHFNTTPEALTSLLLFMEGLDNRSRDQMWLELVINANISFISVANITSTEWFDSLDEISDNLGKPRIFPNQAKVELSSLNCNHIRLIGMNPVNEGELEIQCSHLHPLKGQWSDMTTFYFATVLAAFHPILQERLTPVMEGMVSHFLDQGMSLDDIASIVN